MKPMLPDWGKEGISTIKRIRVTEMSNEMSKWNDSKWKQFEVARP